MGTISSRASTALLGLLALGGPAVGQFLLIPPAPAGPADVAIAVHTQQGVKPISPYVYGINAYNQTSLTHAPLRAGMMLNRLGGNRWTAFNWENGASNAGSDYLHQNDNLLVFNQPSGVQNLPGQAVRPVVEDAHAQDAAVLLTVPTIGYVAADKLGNGDVNQTAGYLTARFRQSLPDKPGAPGSYSMAPDAADATVYQDEFVWWLKQTYPYAATHPTRQIFYSLDNEPDLWSETHPRIRPTGAPTYAEMITRCTQYATAIKGVEPAAVVFGPVNYGWYGYVRLQGASDAANRDFLDFFLQKMALAHTAAGQRLVDVLDVHWYPEATGGGVRVTSNNTSEAVNVARMQAPRSLWDTSYVETSWITTDWLPAGDKPIRLIPRLLAKIAAHYPSTKLAITEYNYGAGAHISGGLAQADVLGVFGREGLFAACWWDLDGNRSFVLAAFDLFRNFDGAGGKFGSTSVQAATSLVADVTAYAATDTARPGEITLVLINKNTAARTAALSITHDHRLRLASRYQISSASAAVVPQADVSLAGQINAVVISLPARSATLLRLLPCKPGDLNADNAVDAADARIAAGNFGKATLQHRASGDLNGDQAVNALDLALLASAIGY